MTENTIIGVAMGAALVLIMFSMGLVLTVRDFARVAYAPRAVLFGVAAQVILLPLIAGASVYAFDLSIAAGVGLLLVAICPGGPVSNFFSYVSRGDAALSVTLTLMSTILSLTTLPAIFAWSPMRDFAHGNDTPIGFILKSLLMGVVLPTIVGMIVRIWWPRAAARSAQYLERIGVSLILVVLTLMMYGNRSFYADMTAIVLAAVVFVNIGGMTVGYLLAGMTRQARSTRITYAFEVGLQNVPLASVLAYGLFRTPGNEFLAVVIAVIGLYAIVSVVSALGASFLFKQAVPSVIDGAPATANPK